MAKSLSGATVRAGKSVTIGDNRYGLREVYDAEEDQEGTDATASPFVA